MPVTETEAKAQVFRLRGLRGFPKSPGDLELVRVALESSRNLVDLHKAISTLIDEETDCPKPATLRSLLRVGRIEDYASIPPHRVCPYGLCVGDGWRVHYRLHTRNLEGFVTKEAITKEQADALKGKLDPKKQTIYDGVSRCKCEGRG